MWLRHYKMRDKQLIGPFHKVVVRMCAGTGSSGATIRMYVEQYVAPDAGPEKLHADAAKALEPLVNVALTLSKMRELTGRDKPTVIT